MQSVPGRPVHIGFSVVAACALQICAAAAGPVPTLRIPAEPVDRALIDLAVQAGIFLGGPLHACTGVSPQVVGAVPTGQALGTILSRSNCRYAMPDPATVVVTVESPQPQQSVQARDPSMPASEDVVVTAMRRPELPGATPYALTAVSNETLGASRLFDMQDLATQVAGMTVTNLGPGRNKVILRGVSDGSFTGLAQSPVAIYLDSSPITFDAPDPDLRLADVNRVEVLRGPQGALYGGGSIGGVVRIISNLPDLIEFAGNAKTSISSTRGGGINDDEEAMVNWPLIAGRVAVRGVAYREAESGYIDDAGRRVRKVNTSVREGGRAALMLKLSDDWTVLFSGAVQSIGTADTHYGLRRLPPLVRDQLIHEPHENDFTQSRLALDGRGAWGSLSVSATYLLHNFTSRYDASPVLSSFGTFGLAAFDESKDIGLTALEATYASPHGQILSWLVGGYVSRGHTTSASTITRLVPATGQIYDENRSDTVTETAIYGDLSLNLTDSFSVSAGGRLFQYRFDTSSTLNQPASTRNFSGRDRDSGFSPKIVIEYQPTDGVILYSEASGGYRGGGFNTSGLASQLFDGSVDHVTREYSPDTIWNYEVGAKIVSPDGSIRIRAAAFFDRWRDLQSDQFQTSGLPFTANIGDGVVRGLELEAAWRVSDELDFGLSTLIQDSELTRAQTAIGILPPDAGLPGTPDLSAAATLDFRKQLDFGARLHILGSITYVGHSFLTFDPDRVFGEGGYATANLSAALEFDDYKVAAFVTNVADSAANTFAFGNPFRMRTDPEVTPLQPRTIGIELSASF